MVSKKAVKKKVVSKPVAKVKPVEVKPVSSNLVETAPVQTQKLNLDNVTENVVKTEKKSPALVKVIAVLYAIGAVLLLLFGILMATLGQSTINGILTQSGINGLGAGVFIVLGILMILVGILYGFICHGLWTVKKWAWIVAIVFACLGVLFSLITLFTNPDAIVVIRLLLNGLIGGYLLFAKEVKEAFA
jgi:membrane glycosyltransferase